MVYVIVISHPADLVNDNYDPDQDEPLEDDGDEDDTDGALTAARAAPFIRKWIG